MKLIGVLLLGLMFFVGCGRQKEITPHSEVALEVYLIASEVKIAALRKVDEGWQPVNLTLFKGTKIFAESVPEIDPKRPIAKSLLPNIEVVYK